MLKTLPAWLAWIIYVLIAFIVIILVALVVHALGGGLLNLHLGHFIFKIGVT